MFEQTATLARLLSSPGGQWVRSSLAGGGEAVVSRRHQERITNNFSVALSSTATIQTETVYDPFEPNGDGLLIEELAMQVSDQANTGKLSLTGTVTAEVVVDAEPGGFNLVEDEILVPAPPPSGAGALLSVLPNGFVAIPPPITLSDDLQIVVGGGLVAKQWKLRMTIAVTNSDGASAHTVNIIMFSKRRIITGLSP